MVKRCCILCKNGQTTTKKRNKNLQWKNKTLFKAPNDINKLLQWGSSLINLKKPLTQDSYVCEDHFKDDDIIKWDEMRLIDGTIYHSKRALPKLKDGAIPIPTTKTTCNLSDQHIELESDIVSGVIVDTINVNMDSALNESIIENPQCTASENSEWSFHSLLKSYRNFPLPNQQWAGIIDKEEKTVIFLTLREEIFRRIEINEDLSIQVYLDEIPVRVKHLPSLAASEQDILNVLKSIDSMDICENFKEAKRLLKK